MGGSMGWGISSGEYGALDFEMTLEIKNESYMP